MIQKICWEVRTKIIWKGQFNGNGENMALCANWDIPTSVLI